MMVTIALMVGLVLLAVLMTNVIEGNEHYNWVPLGGIEQDAVDSFETLNMDPENPTSTSTAAATVARAKLAPTLIPDAFGKGKHGALCWDMAELQFSIEAIGGNIANASVTTQVGLSDGPQPGAIRNPSSAEYVESWSPQRKNLQSAAGESIIMHELEKRMPQPMQVINGESFHNLLTKAAYWLSMDGTDTGVAQIARAGMKARQVMVPLDEVFIDRDTIEALISFGVLSGILTSI